MAFTPRTIVLAARGGIALATAGVVAIGATEPAAPSAMLLAGGGWGATLLVLAAFPRVRKNDLLAAVAGCGALVGGLTAAGDVADFVGAAIAGLAGPAAVALTVSMMRVRQLAASNEHMPFVEWRRLDRRRRSEAQLPAPPMKTLHIRD
jgi:hypothetical protein